MSSSSPDLRTASSETLASRMRPRTLDDYVGRMKEGQDEIYFLIGPTKEATAQSPLLESFRAKGYEVLRPTEKLVICARSKNENAAEFTDRVQQVKLIGRHGGTAAHLSF